MAGKKPALERSSFIFIRQWPGWKYYSDLLKGCWLIPHNSSQTWTLSRYPSYSLYSKFITLFRHSLEVYCHVQRYRKGDVCSNIEREYGSSGKLTLVASSTIVACKWSSKTVVCDAQLQHVYPINSWFKFWKRCEIKSQNTSFTTHADFKIRLFSFHILRYFSKLLGSTTGYIKLTHNLIRIFLPSFLPDNVEFQFLKSMTWSFKCYSVVG